MGYSEASPDGIYGVSGTITPVYDCIQPTAVVLRSGIRLAQLAATIRLAPAVSGSHRTEPALPVTLSSPKVASGDRYATALTPGCCDRALACRQQ